MNEKLKANIENLLSSKIESIQSVSGGDISTAYKIKTPSALLFIKTNSSDVALDMFKKEASGLKKIAATETIATPEVIAVDKIESTSFLIMEFVQSKMGSKSEFELFGRQLAQLHKCTSKTFGLESDNYIGSLSQSNKQRAKWIDFYANERLIPQLEIAKLNNGLNSSEIPSPKAIDSTLKNFFVNIQPSLLHGDLWSGNYLISEDGMPYLIDPAIYYGHSEVDIAMSQLFGGFGDAFYHAYYDEIPQDQYTQDRIQLYQLYYLLVHLNLFGNSYRSSVIEILRKYF